MSRLLQTMDASEQQRAAHARKEEFQDRSWTNTPRSWHTTTKQCWLPTTHTKDMNKTYLNRAQRRAGASSRRQETKPAR